jgi:ferredoxin
MVDLHVNWIACEGRGLCLEMFPELLHGDDWGYPIVAAGGVPPELLDHARRTVAACPTLALRLVESADR